jgi:hypothetical protein
VKKHRLIDLEKDEIVQKKYLKEKEILNGFTLQINVKC